MMSATRDTSIIKPAVDNLVAFALVVAVVLWESQRHVSPGAFEDLIRGRLTLLHAFFGVAFVSLWRFCFDAVDAYSARRGVAILGNLGCCLVMAGLVGLFLGSERFTGSISRVLLLFLLATLAYQAFRWVIHFCWIRIQNLRTKNVIILGSGRRASKAWRELRTRDYEAKTLLGFVDDRSPSSMAPDIAGRYLGRTDELSEYLFRHAVDELIIAAPLQSEYAMTQRAVTIAESAGIRVLCLDDVFTLAPGRVRGEQGSLLREILPAKAAVKESGQSRHFFDTLVSSLGVALFLRMRLFSKGPAQKL